MPAYLKDFYLLYTTGDFITSSPDNIVPRTALPDPSDLQLLFPGSFFMRRFGRLHQEALQQYENMTAVTMWGMHTQAHTSREVA